MKQDFWQGYLSEGYFDAKGNLRLGYIQRETMEEFAEEIVRDVPSLTATQLRRYFGHCRRLEAKMSREIAKLHLHQCDKDVNDAQTSIEDEAVWNSIRAEFLIIDPIAENAFSAKNAKLSAGFYEFLKRNVAAVKSAKDFKEGFMPHFEALVGFGSRHTKRGD